MEIDQKAEVKPLQRVTCYVDGFNLYFGLIASDFRRYLWLNVGELAKRLLLPHQELTETKYFTARISGARPGDTRGVAIEKNAKRKRQTNYLDVLESIGGITVFEGKYYETNVVCHNCDNVWIEREEKMTDVSIATEMMTDAFQDLFDTALLVSADSDLVPPVKALTKLFPEKRVVVAFPPGRHSAELLHVAKQFQINESALRKSQLPESVTVISPSAPKGFTVTRPTKWN
jgi:uncharacterized LabA/DUF88 family protein